MSLPSKPRYGEACNGCGLCCAIEICEVGKIAFKGAKAPCPALKLSPAGDRTYCELVLLEKLAVEQKAVDLPLIAIGLGIGNGCSMQDEEKRECVIPEWA
jgi:hypothetical protein